jgi:hypothetical protein
MVDGTALDCIYRLQSCLVWGFIYFEQVTAFILYKEPIFRTAGDHGGVRVDVKNTSLSTEYTLFIGRGTIGPTRNRKPNIAQGSKNVQVRSMEAMKRHI